MTEYNIMQCQLSISWRDTNLSQSKHSACSAHVELILQKGDDNAEDVDLKVTNSDIII